MTLISQRVQQGPPVAYKSLTDYHSMKPNLDPHLPNRYAAMLDDETMLQASQWVMSIMSKAI